MLKPEAQFSEMLSKMYQGDARPWVAFIQSQTFQEGPLKDTLTILGLTALTYETNYRYDCDSRRGSRGD
jgi:hypothetical protein